jgi:peptidoglycan/xylan/chitin deacetylase (PgdA/CDA1 family)
MTNWPFHFIYQSGCLKIIRTFKRSFVTVLSLHKISNEKNFFFQPISPVLFEELLKYLKQYYQVTTFSQLSDGKVGKKPLAIISFDDGYHDFLEHAVPLLKKYNLSCNHNVVIDCLDSNMIIWTEKLNAVFQELKSISDPHLSIRIEDIQYRFADSRNWIGYYNLIFKHLCRLEREVRNSYLEYLLSKYSVEVKASMMSWSDLKSLDPSLVEIGSHTCSHDVLPTIKDKERLRFEISHSKWQLEQALGREISLLALPNGFGNKEVSDIAFEVGYKRILTVNDKGNKQGHLNYINRLNMVQENKSSMFCRVEGVHSKMKSVFGYE